MKKEEIHLWDLNRISLIYLDSDSTGHKPKRVLDRLYKFYTEEYAKPNESHSLSQQATEQQQEARQKLATFIGAKAQTKWYSAEAVSCKY